MESGLCQAVAQARGTLYQGSYHGNDVSLDESHLLPSIITLMLCTHCPSCENGVGKAKNAPSPADISSASASASASASPSSSSRLLDDIEMSDISAGEWCSHPPPLGDYTTSDAHTRLGSWTLLVNLTFSSANQTHLAKLFPALAVLWPSPPLHPLGKQLAVPSLILKRMAATWGGCAGSQTHFALPPPSPARICDLYSPSPSSSSSPAAAASSPCPCPSPRSPACLIPLAHNTFAHRYKHKPCCSLCVCASFDCSGWLVSNLSQISLKRLAITIIMGR